MSAHDVSLRLLGRRRLGGGGGGPVHAENVGSAGGVVLWQPRALGCVGSHGAAIAGAATGAARRARGFGGMSTIEDYAPAQQQQRERERAPTAVLGAVGIDGIGMVGWSTHALPLISVLDYYSSFGL